MRVYLVGAFLEIADHFFQIFGQYIRQRRDLFRRTAPVFGRKSVKSYDPDSFFIAEARYFIEYFRSRVMPLTSFHPAGGSPSSVSVHYEGDVFGNGQRFIFHLFLSCCGKSDGFSAVAVFVLAA